MALMSPQGLLQRTLRPGMNSTAQGPLSRDPAATGTKQNYMHILPTRYLITVVIVVAAILCAVWFLDGIAGFICENTSF